MNGLVLENPDVSLWAVHDALIRLIFVNQLSQGAAVRLHAVGFRVPPVKSLGGCKNHSFVESAEVDLKRAWKTGGVVINVDAR